MKLLTIDGNTKIQKSDNSEFEIKTAILHLAPGDLSGKEVCPWRTPVCTAACLNTAGRGVFDMVKDARSKKTVFFFENRSLFMNTLKHEIFLFEKRNDKKGVKTAVRLNGTSDLSWENIKFSSSFDVNEKTNIMKLFPNVQFYDYTKSLKRTLKFLNGDMPFNYHLTYSATENNEAECQKILEKNGTVAMIFEKNHVPETYTGYGVLDGDKHDLRFLDEPGNVVGLGAKGPAKYDLFSGFVKQRQLAFAFMAPERWVEIFNSPFALFRKMVKETRKEWFQNMLNFWNVTPGKVAQLELF